jgi:hypothetical protein
MKTIAFIQAKGGVAKTTCSVLLSAVLARRMPENQFGFLDLSTSMDGTKWLQSLALPNVSILSSTESLAQAEADGVCCAFIDTPGDQLIERSLSLLPPALFCCVIPVGHDTPEVECAERTIRAMRAKRPEVPLKLLWTRLFSARSLRSAPERLRSIEARLGIPTLKARIEYSVRYGASRDEGLIALDRLRREAIENVGLELLMSSSESKPVKRRAG